MASMRVAVDCRELLGRPTGVGRYLAGILDAWKTFPIAKAHEFVLCFPEAPSPQVNEAYGTFVRAVRAGRGTWWEQTTLPGLVRQSGADVLFSPGYTSPLICQVPAVVAVHDVSFSAHPEWFSTREGFRRRLLTRLSARRAARVLTISNFSKAEIIERLGVRAESIDVVYPGFASMGTTAELARTRSPRTILYVGSLFTRRHIPELMTGFVALQRRRPTLRLEIVGDNRTLPRVDVDLLRGEIGGDACIGLRSFVSDHELSALYQQAAAFVFLSDYEGFGLTPLEALAAGVPIVVLDTPVAREVYGEAALYVERAVPELIEAALERILDDGDERQRILGAARSVVARYTWERCATQVLDVLVKVSECRVSR
jgi:glycosyltransferase involved in cell wall biosynthesis